MAPIARRTTVVALVVTLLAGVLALAGPVAPVGALTHVQEGVKPSDRDCSNGRLHPNGTIGTCGPITVTGSVKVDGADVAAGTALAIGDVVTVSVVVPPRGGHAAMYAETADGIRSNQYDTEAVVPIGLPAQTGTLLSAPTAVTMSRTDEGDREGGPAANCVTQSGQDAARTDGPTAITLGADPVGRNGMVAAVDGSTLTARWTTMAADRCVTLAFNNGFYPGWSISFTQTVLGQGATAQTPTWSLGGLTLRLDDEVRALTWGSAKSAALSLPALPPGAPAAPTGVTAVRGAGQATVSWTAPAANGSPITGYTITPHVGGVAQPAQTFAGTATTRTVTGLANGTAYAFAVAATNGVGTGPASTLSPVVTPATVPGAPTGVTAGPGHGRATVTWTAPAATGGSPVTGYRVTPRIGDVAQPSTTFASTATTQTVTGLADGTAHTFTVAAINDVGPGAESAASAVVTPVAPWAPFATAEAFTRQQFQDLAGRQPTLAERVAWQEALETGAATAPERVESLRSKTHWDGTLGPVIRLYRAVYRRDPETGGLVYWEGEVRSRRQTINRMAEVVARGAEFRALYGNLSDAAFVTKVYQLVLERPPAPSDLAYWTGELRRGQGRGRMVLLFSGSAEYRARSADRVAAILVRYGMLRQVGTGADVDAATALVADRGVEALIGSVLAGPEYAARVRP